MQKKAEAMKKRNQKKTIALFFINGYIYISDEEIQKNFGFIFHEDGSWYSHLNKIIEKITPTLNLVGALKFKVESNHLQAIYFSFI